MALHAASAPPRLALMPRPASVELHDGRVPIGPGTTVAVTGYTDDRLHGAVDRALLRLEGRTGYTFPRPAAVDPASAAIVVFCHGPGDEIPSIDENESYTIDASGAHVRLEAPTVIGAMRGLETVLQLVTADRDGFYVPAGHIEDAPRFRWRGLLIDVGRHFEPIGVIERNLDAMAAVKLNVLHWHLSEDQGFRVESRKYPELQEAGSDGQFYTQDELRAVVEYARQRGIRVVPEFDMPGHVSSWLVGHPELGSAPGPYHVQRGFGVFDPSFDPTRESTYKFLDGFIGEMAAIFPDAYFHIGGDEDNGKAWAANPQIQAFMRAHGLADAHALQTYFNQRLLKILEKHHKRMMGWDEIFQPDLPKQIVIQSWRGPKALIDAARQGYDGVLSAGYYIDLMQPASAHYAVDPLPDGSGLTREEAAHVLGGEATMWGEYVGPETIDSRIWPRTAAIAERLWSPANTRDVNDMYRRLDAVSLELEALGITSERNVDVLLRRLAGTDAIAPLRTLVDAIEPVKGYRRGQLLPSTTLTPLTHLVDAARPDAPAARAVSTEVDMLLADAPRFEIDRASLQSQFADWRDLRPDLNVLMDGSPALAEARPLATSLEELGQVGLDAIAYLTHDVAPPPDWRDAQMTVLDRAGQAKAALEFPFLPAMRELVLAAAEWPQLATMTPDAWVAHLKTLATPVRPRGGGRPRP